MSKNANTGYYLEQTLLARKISKKDVSSLLAFVLQIPEKDYGDDFKMSEDVRFALKGIKDAYTVLNRKYEPSVEYVNYNSSLQEEIITSLKKLAGLRKNSRDDQTIEALKENFNIERFRKQVNNGKRPEEENFVGKIKFIFKKRKML